MMPFLTVISLCAGVYCGYEKEVGGLLACALQQAYLKKIQFTLFFCLSGVECQLHVSSDSVLYFGNASKQQKLLGN